MLLGVLLGKKRYPLAKYMYVFMIVVGICFFMYKDKPDAVKSEEASLLGIGEILLVCSLFISSHMYL